MVCYVISQLFEKGKFQNCFFFFFLSRGRSVRIFIMYVCTYMCKVDHLTQHFRILPTMWMKYFIKLHLNVYKTFKIVGYYFQKKSLMSYADLVICQKIKCNYFKFISCLTLFQLGGITFTTVTVYHVTKPS